ncbi:MAG: peptidase, partial [Solibacillus isronensis]
MPILDTKILFEKTEHRELAAYPIIQSIFPRFPPEAVQFELLQQGLLQHEELRLTLDVWQISKRLLEELIRLWDGPDIPVAILPIKNGFV